MRIQRIVHGVRTRGQVGLRIIGLLAVALLAAGCGTTSVGGDYTQAEARAESLAGAGRSQDAARIYIALAGDAQGDERTRLTLLAVEQWLRAGDTVRARTAFASTALPTDGELRTDWLLTSARLDLAVGEPETALGTLASLDDRRLDVGQRLQRDALRGAALFGVGRTLEGLQLLVRREMWLDDGESIRSNHDIIWAGLTATPPADLESALADSSDRLIRGWLQLGLVGARAAGDAPGLRRGIIDWRREYPDHPALADLVPSLLDVELLATDYPRQIAVLLPLSGRSAAAAAAIREGLLGAWYSDPSEGTRPVLRFYDVAADGNVYSYRRALEEGAEFVIGPLLKSSVMELATAAEITVPTLALNTLPAEVEPPTGLYQYALAPEDEAAQVATRAMLDDRQRGVALIPRSDWGSRVLDAFANSLQLAGGQLLDYREYEVRAADFSDTIEGLMLLDESVARYRQLRNLIGEPLQFEPRRRQDIDFIFLAADGPTARLLRPQLRFHYAGGIPIYATSAINARDGRSDNDLNGVLFPEVPWIVSESPEVEALRTSYRTLWPGSGPFARLQAMGFDAYRLVGAVQQGSGTIEPPLPGMSGELTMDLSGVVHRRLPFAKFEAGEIVAVAEPVPDVRDTGELPEGVRLLITTPPATPTPESWREPDDSD